MQQRVEQYDAHDPETGEITAATGTELAVIDAGTLAVLTRVEIESQVATAKQYPRSVTRAAKNILSLATMDPETSEECMYALPRGGKPIVGPSIRFAEILASQWGNLRAAARVIKIDRENKHVEAEGICHDLETNQAQKATVLRRITDKQGRLLRDDMILVTCNAACAIAKRNAILAVVPKPVWRRAYMAVEGISKGDVTTMKERWTQATKAFASYGVKPEQLYAVLGIAGEEELTVDHFPALTGMRAAIKNGEATVEELFHGGGKNAAFEKLKNPLADKAPAAPEASKEPSGETPKTADDVKADLVARGLMAADAPPVDEHSLDAIGEQGAAGAPPQDEPTAETVVSSKPEPDHSWAEAEAEKRHEARVAADTEAKKEEPAAITRAKEAGRIARGMGEKRSPPKRYGGDRVAEQEAWLAGYDETGS